MLKRDVTRFITHVQTCLATNKVARILSSIGQNYAGVLPYTGVTPLVAKQVCLGPVKRATYTDFVAKSRTNFYFLQQIVLNVSGKMQHRFSNPFTAMLQNKLHIFGARFTVWYLIRCILACCFHMVT